MSPVNTIRRAEIGDLEAISKLQMRAESSLPNGPESLDSLFATGVFLVLDGDSGDLDASLYVCVDGSRGEASHIAIAPERQTVELRERLLSVAEAMCIAQGCEQFIAQWPHDPYIASAM